MKSSIVSSLSPVTLVGGGQTDSADLSLALKHAPVLVAADGGADLPLSLGLVPEAVIGDFDSLSAAARASLPSDALHPIDDQDTTDFDKALAAVSAPVVLGIGFTGRRIDHQLAAFSSLPRFAHKPCVLLAPDEIVFLAPRVLDVPLKAGTVVSLYPLMPAQGRSEGLEWPIDGLILRPGGRLGTSNRATGPLRLESEAPGLLVILPRTALGSVMSALQAPAQERARWPVPA